MESFCVQAYGAEQIYVQHAGPFDAHKGKPSAASVYILHTLLVHTCCR